MDKFKKIEEELNRIKCEAKSPKELLDKINASIIIKLEKDIGFIFTDIRLHSIDLFNPLLEELIAQGKTNLIINNIQDMGILPIIEFAIESNNEELIEHIGKNFKELMKLMLETSYVEAEDVKNIISNKNLRKEFHKEIKETIPTIIQNVLIKDRLALIGYILNQNQELGNLEEYLSDFLTVSDKIKRYDRDNINYILCSLEVIGDIDKKELLKAINENFDDLINSFREDEVSNIKKFIATIKRIESKVASDSKDVEDLKEEIDSKISRSFEETLKEYRYNIDLIDLYRRYNIDNSRFKNIQDDIINELSGADLVRYIQSSKGNEGFDKNWDYSELTRQLFKNSEDIKKDSTVQFMISKLLEELCEHENVGIEGIEFAGSGAFSFNIKIGNFVLKLGEGVCKYERRDIPNDKRILKPILRQEYNEEEHWKIADLFIEVQNFVDAKWYEGLSEEEVKEQLYIIYSELRDRGIRWTDIKPENVGRLLRPNKENYEEETLSDSGKIEIKELKSSDYAIGFEGENPDEVLGQGELVIIDLDYIYRANDKFGVPKNSYYKEFEERYQKGKRENSNISICDIKGILSEEGYTREDFAKIEQELYNLINKDIDKGEK